MLYIFNQDDKFQNIITEETGLIDTWFKDYQNHLIDEPFVFHVESDSDLLHLIKDENQVAFYDRDNRLRLMRIKEVYERSTSDGYIVEVICEPSFLELYDHFVEDRRINNGTAQSALNSVLQGSRYTGNVTVDLGNQTTNFYWINGVDGIFKIIDTWGGALVDTIELDENNEIIERKIIIQQRLGADNGLLIEPDYNAESIERSTLSYPVTAMWGQGASLETENGGYTRYITFEDVEWKVSKGDPVDKPKGQKWVGDPQALAKYGYLHNNQRMHRFGHFSNQNYETPEELLMATWLALQEAKHPEVNHESTINVDRPVSLGDTATIIDRNYNKPIELQSQITGLEYDILEPDEQVKVVLGKYVDMNVEPWEKELDDIKQEVARPKPTKPIDNSSFPDVKPGTPTNVQAIGSFQVIQLYWDYDSAVYVSHYEVYASKIKDFVPDSQYLIYRGRVSAFGHEVQTDEMWYYRIRAVNTRGTPSDFSNQVSAASVRINTPDIMFGGIIADHLESNLDIAEKLAQNTIDRINEGPMQEITYTQQQIEATEEAILNQLNSQIGDVNSAINSLNTTADNLKLRVDDTEDLLLQHGNKFTNIETEINTIDGRISATITNVERIDNTVNSHSTTLTAHAGLINAKLDSLTYQTDKTGIVNRIESNETEIDLLSTGLELRVTKEEFEALSIGGRNLILGSATPYTYAVASNNFNYWIAYRGLERNTTYTFSAKVEVLQGSVDLVSLYPYVQSGQSMARTEMPIVNGEIKGTFTTDGRYDYNLLIYNGESGSTLGNQIRLIEYQLEKGNKATDWTPAPEDIDNQFTVITNRVTTTETTLTAHAGLISAKAEKSEVYTKTEVNTRLNTKVETTVYENKVGQLDVAINGITSRVSNTETNINGLTGEVNTAKSQIGQLEVKADQVDIRVSEIQTGISNKELTRKLGIENINRSYERNLSTTDRPLRLGTYSLIDRGGEKVIYNNGVYSLMYSEFIPNVKDAKHYVDMDVLYEGNTQGTVYIQLLFYNKNKTEAGSNGLAMNFVGAQPVTKIDEWQKFSGYIDMSEQSATRKNAYYVVIRVLVRYTGVNEKAYIRNLSWKQLNSQSVAESVASIQTLAGQINLKASQTSVNSLTGRMSTAETTLNLLPGQLNAKVSKNGVISEINATPESIRIASKLIHLSGTSQIDDAVIGTAAIANAAIKRAHLQDAIIGNAQIANSAITNAKIANATIDDAKIASLSVTKLLAGEIDTSKIKIRGGSANDYTLIDGSFFESRGRFTRTWRNVTKTHDIKLRFENGYLRARNDTENGSLYFSDYGISTQVDGNADGMGSSGTLEFFTPEYSGAGASGVTLSSYGGVVALKSSLNRIVLDSAQSVNLESKTAPIYLRPRINEVAGSNVFNFTVTDSQGADGYIYYGSETNGYGVGMRLSKSREYNTIWITDGNGVRWGTTKLSAGYLESRILQSVDGNFMYIGSSAETRSVSAAAYASGNITYIDHRARFVYADALDINGGTNLYLRPRSNGEVIVTATGSTTTHRPIRASAFNESSSREFKTNIEVYKESALEVINGLTVVNYNLKDDLANGINDLKIGFISEDSEAIATLDKKAIQTYKLSAYNTKAIQELDVKVYNIEKRLDEKDLEMQYLKQKVQQQDLEIKQLKELLEAS